MQTLDVRPMPPRVRHETIFERIDRLTSGETLRLVNDHDPKPLYYQFKAELGQPFEWDYLESGPEVWKVRIARPAN